MSCAAKAKAAWGKELPEWIEVLAGACDREGLRKVAERIGVSPAMVSLAVNKKRANLDFIRDRVTSAFITGAVDCPVLDVIDKQRCLQEQAAPFSCANPLRVQLYRACRNGCPHYQQKKENV